MRKLKLLVYIIIFCGFYSYCYSQQTLVWSDEFNNDGSIDTQKWGYELGYIRNNELQYYTNRASNSTVRNGCLEIIAQKEAYNGYNYTSASINTKGKFSWTYGKIEARIKLPLGQGYWPAFWTLGTNINQIGWPACGEIDIMEHINSEAFIHGTAHWSGITNSHVSAPSAISTNIDFTDFHVYSIVWTPNAIVWFVDNIQFCTLNILDGINGTSELNLQHYILLNLAIGGSWPGAPTTSTVFPATMFVDYVRVYQVPPSAITEIKKNNDDLLIKISEGNCTVKLPQIVSEFEFSILDIQGRYLFKTKVYNSDEANLNFKPYKERIYVAKVYAEGKTLSKRFVKY